MSHLADPVATHPSESQPTKCVKRGRGAHAASLQRNSNDIPNNIIAPFYKLFISLQRKRQGYA